MNLPTPDWSPDDVQIFKSFIATPTGQRFIARLVNQVPSLLAEGDTNKILIRAGEVRGCQRILSEITMASRVEPQLPVEEHSAYPSLHDDEAWGDGKKMITSE